MNELPQSFNVDIEQVLFTALALHSFAMQVGETGASCIHERTRDVGTNMDTTGEVPGLQ